MWYLSLSVSVSVCLSLCLSAYTLLLYGAGDTWDVLAEPNFTKSLAGYRVVALGGEVQLAQPQLTELSQWVREGGVVLAFASQLRTVDRHAEFVGMGLGDSRSVHISNVTDEETHWSSQADDHSNQRPFCVPGRL